MLELPIRRRRLPKIRRAHTGWALVGHAGSGELAAAVLLLLLPSHAQCQHKAIFQIISYSIRAENGVATTLPRVFLFPSSWSLYQFKVLINQLASTSLFDVLDNAGGKISRHLAHWGIYSRGEDGGLTEAKMVDLSLGGDEGGSVGYSGRGEKGRGVIQRVYPLARSRHCSWCRRFTTKVVPLCVWVCLKSHNQDW